MEAAKRNAIAGSLLCANLSVVGDAYIANVNDKRVWVVVKPRLHMGDKDVLSATARVINRLEETVAPSEVRWIEEKQTAVCHAPVPPSIGGGSVIVFVCVAFPWNEGLVLYPVNFPEQAECLKESILAKGLVIDKRTVRDKKGNVIPLPTMGDVERLIEGGAERSKPAPAPHLDDVSESVFGDTFD